MLKQRLRPMCGASRRRFRSGRALSGVYWSLSSSTGGDVAGCSATLVATVYATMGDGSPSFDAKEPRTAQSYRSALRGTLLTSLSPRSRVAAENGEGLTMGGAGARYFVRIDGQQVGPFLSLPITKSEASSNPRGKHEWHLQDVRNAAAKSSRKKIQSPSPDQRTEGLAI